MIKVQSQIKIGKYLILSLDSVLPNKPFTRILLDGEEHEAIPVYDMRDSIGLVSSDNYVGKPISFIYE